MRRLPTVLLASLLLAGCQLLPIQSSASEFSVASDLAIGSLSESLLNAYEDSHTNARLSLATTSRSGALDWLEQGQVDAAIILHPPDEGFFHTPIARDGIIFVVSPDTRIDNLTERDVRALLAGRVAAWPDAGSSPLPVQVIVGDADSSVRLAVEDLLMRGQAIAPAARIVTDSGQVLSLVAATPGMISFIPYSALTVDNVKPLSLNGIPPTPEFIAAHQYSLVTTIEFVAREEPEGSVRAFLDWLVSSEGQEVVRRQAFGLND